MTDRESSVERLLHRVEQHIEEWRERSRDREAELEARRERMWEEAVERERLLVRLVRGEKPHEPSLEEVARGHRVVFVVHSEAAGKVLEDFAAGRTSLINVVPGRGGVQRSADVKGSWLVFD